MRKAGLLVLAIAGAYYLSLLIFGPMALTAQLKKDSNSYYDQYRWTNDINVVGNVNVDEISNIFSGPDVRITFLRSDDVEEVVRSFSIKERYNYLLMRDSMFRPIVLIYESEQINEYVANWEKTYLWCFAFWIPLENRSMGMS